MKKGMCNGCDSLTEAAETFWINEGTPEAVQLTRMAPFCDDYGLHFGYIEEIVPGDTACIRYKKDGLS
jgi:hypothetical protein